jgi:hypothetical protein
MHFDRFKDKTPGKHARPAPAVPTIKRYHHGCATVLVARPVHQTTTDYP